MFIVLKCRWKINNGYIFVLSDKKYSFSIAIKKFENFNISTRQINDIINTKGKKRQNLLFTWKKAQNVYPTKVSIPVIKSKVASHVLKEKSHPPKN